jgi:hypothetical protein
MMKTRGSGIVVLEWIGEEERGWRGKGRVGGKRGGREEGFRRWCEEMSWRLRAEAMELWIYDERK